MSRLLVLGSFGEGMGCRPSTDPVSGTLVSPVVKVFEQGWDRGGLHVPGWVQGQGASWVPALPKHP